MSNKFVFAFLSLIISSSTFCAAIQQNPIVIVTASYNNAEWYKWNLNSVFNQDYKNWHLVYVDDCSSDCTGELVQAYIKECGFQNKVTLIQNKTRRGAMSNQYFAINQLCKATDIVIILDGDDWFEHAGVLSYINDVYAAGDTWLTYGQFREYPSGRIGFCCSMPENVVKNNAFRSHADIPSHLRTFYAGLFQKIRIEDLAHEGAFFSMCADIAAMFPMIEMARDHFKFIPEVLLGYNEGNPINDFKVSKPLQRSLDLKIRSLPRYEKIASPF